MSTTSEIKGISLSAFADKLDELMSGMSKEFFKHQTEDFFKTKITMPQFVILNILNSRGELKMTDLAKFLNVTTAAVTGLADRLVRDGYIIRGNDPEDRRIVKVKLTEKGSGLVKAMKEKRRKMVMGAFGKISQKERETYLGILMHMREHLVSG